MYDKKLHLGEVRLSLQKAPKEALVDTWVPLKVSGRARDALVCLRIENHYVPKGGRRQ